MADPVENRIAQIHVRRGHVDLGAQRLGAVRKLSSLHPREQIQILFRRAIAERAVLARFGQAAAVLSGLLWRQVANVSLARLDQLDSPIMQLAEVVRSVALFTRPLKTEPLNIALDRIDVFLVFFRRVGVIETEIALATKLLRQTEVQADRLGMADMQVAIGLWREAGDDLGMLTRFQVGLDDRAEKIGGCGSLRLAHGVLNDLRVCGSG